MKITLVAIGIGIVATLAIAAALSIQSENSQDEIRVGYFPNIGHAIPIVGLEKGFFVKNLPDVQIKTRIFDSGPQAIEGLFANSIDIAYVGPGPAVNGFLKSDSNNIRILAGAASGGASFIVHPDSNINSIDDFAGKRIAAPQVANSQDVSLRTYLKENGLETAERGGSVYVLNVANPEIYTLFIKGDIDGAWIPEPWATIFVEKLNGKRLFFEEDLWADKKFSSVLLIARADYVEKNDSIIQKWLESHQETVEWINLNNEETGLIYNDFLHNELGTTLSESVLKESFSNIEITSDPIPKSIEIFAKRSYDLGYLGRNGYDLTGIYYSNQTLGTKHMEMISYHD
ncbi:MAG: aliphatic sulfonate ABC transporter substrate-binding protein [Crenarchaeota archaeon]|nr:MAG: aliphatic sulfonate ABC transporter substrate-binding protein [Thermoproteota archaeon]RDJ32961.1 MAG: aliphatic sulfonate ABC transporter substrate-binding protein [Thermoproteota archaeon]RDJ35835.1 MAG: aliphatic sulfonate ABC transporter substrate-binding protein [Thermoproteota archaeon]RDJ36535.1 MAG: aliphatic sulfonate ABC transporter substrate-binding protein [Thermoproteota archaeon]